MRTAAAIEDSRACASPAHRCIGSFRQWSFRCPRNAASIAPFSSPNNRNRLAILMSWQIEAVSVEGDKLRKQLANLFDEVAYQLCLGSLANVRRAERVDAPALRLAARD